MLLNQISASDAITQKFVKIMMVRARILQFLHFYPMVGNADSVRKASEASGGRVRAIDANYPANQQTPTFDTPTLKIVGDHVQVDQAHERRGQDIVSVRIADLFAFADDLGKTINNLVMNGDSGTTAEEFDGILVRLVASMKVAVPANGFQVILGNDNAAKTSQQEFLEYLDAAIESVDGGANLLYMDGLTIARLSSIARDHIQTMKNELGVPTKYYNEIPIVNAGKDKSGNRIIPQTETHGASANICTSIYALRTGQKVDLCAATNEGMEIVDQGLVGSHWTHKAEMDMDLALLAPDAISVVQGVRLGA